MPGLTGHVDMTQMPTDFLRGLSLSMPAGYDQPTSPNLSLISSIHADLVGCLAIGDLIHRAVPTS